MFKNLYSDLVEHKEKLSLVGLGYVGMPIAVAFAKKINVVGFDLNAAKIDLYKNGIDPTREVGDEAIKASTVEFTADEAKLREAKFHIVAVPKKALDGYLKIYKKYKNEYRKDRHLYSSIMDRILTTARNTDKRIWYFYRLKYKLYRLLHN